jgi:general secretion pathway protein D
LIDAGKLPDDEQTGCRQGGFKVYRFCLFTLVTAVLWLSVCAPVLAQATTQQADDSISLDFKDVELSELIQTMSELTGRNFLFDETVRGKVTIISPGGMKLEEAYQLFLTVLNVKGYTVVPSGKINKIVPIKDAKQINLPVTTFKSGGENYVTRLVPLTYADATDLATAILTPLIPKSSSIVAFAPSNTLVITDSGSNIDRLVKIIKELDVPASLGEMEVFALQYADAEEVAAIANNILGQTAGVINRRSRSARNVKTAGSPATSRVIGYKRTNTLIVIADPEEMELLRNLISRLDAEQSAGRSNINVFYLENADAETLAKTLNEILTGMRTQARATQPGNQVQATPLTQGPVTITADKPTNALLINSNPEDYALLQGIIRQLDIKRKQVYVEALILELSMGATEEVGVSLQGGVEINGDSLVLGTSNLNSGSANLSSLAPAEGSNVPSLLSQTVNGLLLGGMFAPITTTGPNGQQITVPAFSALIQLSEESSDINILSAPRLLTSDNEEAEIIVGSNVPIITSRLTDTGSTGLAQSVSVERQDVALTLRFTPQVTEGDLVRLTVFQEITDISAVSVGNVNEVGPTFTKRQLRNTVLAENGKTIVLGGLIGTNIQSKEVKVPFLGDIPYLGRLFRSDGVSEQKTNLLIFITPKIIRSAEDLAELTLRARMTGKGFQTEALRKSINPDSFITNLSAPDEVKEAPRP